MHAGIYVIYDRKAQSIVNDMLMTIKHEAVAVRTFQDILAQPKAPMRQWPEDYELRRIAYLDTETCDIVAEQTSIITAAALIAAENREETTDAR